MLIETFQVCMHGGPVLVAFPEPLAQAREEGGQEAASQEDEAKGERRRVWPSADAPAHVAKPAPLPPRPRSPSGPQEPPRKSAAEYADEFFRRDPKKDQAVAEYVAAKAARRAKAASRPSAPSTADQPSGAIPGGQEGSPATIPFPAADADADADELNGQVTGRRRHDAAVARASQRDAYHRDRAQG
jgi:hypothetical protein